MRGRWRSLRDRRLVVGAVAVAITLVVTIAVAPWPSGPSHPPRAETVADAQRSAGCAGRAGGRRRRQRPAADRPATRSGPPSTPSYAEWSPAPRVTGARSRSSGSRSPRCPRPRSSSTGAAPTRAPSGRSRSRDSAPGGSRSPPASAPPSPVRHRPDRPVPRASGAPGRLRAGRVGRPPGDRPGRDGRRAVPPGRRHHDRRPRPARPFGRPAGPRRPAGPAAVAPGSSPRS